MTRRSARCKLQRQFFGEGGMCLLLQRCAALPAAAPAMATRRGAWACA